LDDKWYVGYHIMGVKGFLYHLGMNFTLDEWDEMIEKSEEITAQVDSIPVMAKRKYANKSITADDMLVRMYRFEIQNGKGGTLFEGKEWWFLKADAELKMKAAKNDEFTVPGNPQERLWLITSKYFESPCKFKLVSLCCDFLVQKQIDFIIEANCEGCTVGAPSQKRHVESNGCGDPSTTKGEKVAKHFDLAVGKVSAKAIGKLFNKTLLITCLTPQWSVLFATACLKLSSVTEMRERAIVGFASESPLERLVLAAHEQMKDDVLTKKP
jgi:hypothetical protein